MKKNYVSLRRVSLLLLFVAALAGILFVVYSSHEAWAHARTLSNALNGARSVTLVEFHREVLGPALVFSRVSASPEQIAALRSATGAWYAPIPGWQKMCFNPHHRVEVVRGDGSMLRFDICFHCQNFTLGESHAVTMPDAWRDNLHRFFTSAGMPPRDDYSALIKKHPDYHLVEKAWSELDKQPEPLDKTQSK